MALDDRMLVSRIRAGDDDAFELLALRQRPGLVRHARGKLGGRADEAEDVVQEALIKAMRALRGGADPANPAAWLRVIVTRCAYDLHDADKRRPSVPMFDDVHVALNSDPQERVQERSEVERTVAAIHALPSAQREALVGYELMGQTYDELGEEHGWSVPATKSLLWRARTTLQAERRKWAAAFAQPVGLIAATRDWIGSLADKPQALMSAHVGTDALQCAAAVALTAVTAAGAPAVVHHVSGSDGSGSPRDGTRQEAALVARADRPAVLPSAGGTAAPSAAQLHAAAQRQAAVPASASSSAAPGAGSHGDAAPGSGSGDAGDVLRACATGEGSLDGYSTQALTRARRAMPDDLAEYTDCTDRVADALHG